MLIQPCHRSPELRSSSKRSLRFSKTYGETVCCAGVTAEGIWKRLFPVRFRHLKGKSSFGRWDWVDFRYDRPKTDSRSESCHVYEDSITVGSKIGEAEKVALLEPLIVGSGQAAASLGRSLALIRPRNTRFIVKRRTLTQVEEQKQAFARAARQTSFLDKELAALEPSPFEFKFRFEDDAGLHEYVNADWEAHAMFYNGRRRQGEAETLRWMNGVFNEDYPRKGMVFAIGNQAKRPQVWQLLGVIRLDEARQGALVF